MQQNRLERANGEDYRVQQGVNYKVSHRLQSATGLQSETLQSLILIIYIHPHWTS